MKRILDRPWLPVLLAIVALLSITGLLAIHFSHQLENSRAWVLHTDQVILKANDVLLGVQEAEAGQRGFLLTGDEAFLAPYQKAQASLPQQLHDLAVLVSDNPAQSDRINDISTLVFSRMKVIAQTIADKKTGLSPDNTLEQLTQGRLMMDNLRGTIAQAVAEEKNLFLKRLESTRKDERRILATSVAAAALGLSGLIFGAFFLVRTNRTLRQAEGQLSTQSNLLQATLDYTQHGIAAFNDREQLIAFNRRFFLLANIPETLARANTPLSQFKARSDLAASTLFADIPDRLSQNADPDIYFDVKIANRSLEVYRNLTPDGGFLISIIDVTRRAESELIVRQAQKMESIGHLTGGVAHDFNNLLQVISGNIDLALRLVHGHEDVQTRLRAALDGAERGARLTGQLLAFARRQPLAPQVINLGRTVQGMTDLLRRTLGEQIEIEAMVAGGLWNTVVDPGQVENAILNLAINSRDAMSSGGKLTIEVANAFLDDAYARLHSEVMPGQYVMLAVTDTGSGMSPELVSRVFEPFFTTKPEGQGTGLGLSQVYGFVKQSGGHVKIYSEIGQGTTVKIYLPRTRRKEESMIDLASYPVEGGRETVLVVEDDAAVRNAVVDMITDLGYTVLKAENAEAALTIITNGAQVDLLFTDVVMPGNLHTREFARQAQTILPDLAVLFTSGYTENAIIHDGRLDDGVLLISKPYRKDDLARKLRQALSRALSNNNGADLPGLTVPDLESEIAKSSPPQNEGGRVDVEDIKDMTDTVPDHRSVLVVEDEFLIRMATVDMLEELGHTVHEAGGGNEALDILKSDAKIDILLTDLNLPGISGQQLAHEARKLRPAITIVVATGYASRGDAAGAEYPRDTYILAKPYQINQLRDALQNAL